MRSGRRYEGVFRVEKEGILLDLTGCENIAQLHQRMREAFHFPEYYGANLDALWDMGLDYIGTNRDSFTHVKIKGISTLPEDARNYFLKKIMAVFYEIQDEKKSIQFEIEGEEC